MPKSKIYRVDAVQLTVLESYPPKIRIKAYGLVPTGGWSAPELIPYVYIIPPVDGIQDFDFAAQPPPDAAIQVLRPIEASHVIENTAPSWLRGVRVHASSNNKEALLGEDAGKPRTVCIKGTLTDEGIECQALRTEDGELYTLVGDLRGFSKGDTVYVSGTIAQVSFCMQGITIAVQWISDKPPKC